MSTYREFRAQTKKKRRRRLFQRCAMLLLIAVLLGGSAWLIVQLAGGIGADSSEAAQNSSSLVQTDVSQPAGSEVIQSGLLTDGPIQKTINTFDPITPDRRMYALPENGKVDLSYFDDATFVGDSITTGWDVYRSQTGLPNARVVAEKSTWPPVNGALWKDPDTGEIYDPMQAIADTVPKKVYVMFGTNVLVSEGENVEDKLINDYASFIDDLGTRIPGCEIYIQSILIPTAEGTASKPGLNPERINRVNDRLAALAFEKGCHYLDLQELLCAHGVLNWDIAQPDGIHIKPEAYGAWLNYLATHTAYNTSATYLVSPYPATQTEDAAVSSTPAV